MFHGRTAVEVVRDSIAKAWRKARGEEFFFEFRPSAAAGRPCGRRRAA